MNIKLKEFLNETEIRIPQVILLPHQIRYGYDFFADFCEDLTQDDLDELGINVNIDDYYSEDDDFNIEDFSEAIKEDIIEEGTEGILALVAIPIIQYTDNDKYNVSVYSSENHYVLAKDTDELIDKCLSFFHKMKEKAKENYLKNADIK